MVRLGGQCRPGLGRTAEAEGRARGQPGRLSSPDHWGVQGEAPTVRRESRPSWDQTMGTLGWREKERPCLKGMGRQWATGMTKDSCVFAGGGPATLSHPGVHGCGGLPHQLFEDQLHSRPTPEGVCDQVPHLCLVLCPQETLRPLAWAALSLLFNWPRAMCCPSARKTQDRVALEGRGPKGPHTPQMAFVA